MIIYERQEAILNHLKEHKFSTVRELSAVVWASESSVRRDVKALERQGLIMQTYGGVVLSEYKNSVVPLELRDSSNTALKEALAKEAASLVFDGATIMMDGSSTVRRIIKYIGAYKDLKIITNNQKIFSECTHPGVKLYCTGGLFDRQSNIFYGSSTESFIASTYADILFFSSQAISEDGEISDISEEETSLRKVMLSRAKKKVFLCDSSKIGLKKTFTLCTKDDVDRIICNEKLPWEK